MVKKDLVVQACVCDTSVQAVAKAQQNFTPSQFQTGEIYAFVPGILMKHFICVPPVYPVAFGKRKVATTNLDMTV